MEEIEIKMSAKTDEIILLALERADDHSTSDKFQKVYDEISLEPLKDKSNKVG